MIYNEIGDVPDLQKRLLGNDHKKAFRVRMSKEVG